MNSHVGCWLNKLPEFRKKPSEEGLWWQPISKNTEPASIWLPSNQETESSKS